MFLLLLCFPHQPFSSHRLFIWWNASLSVFLPGYQFSFSLVCKVHLYSFTRCIEQHKTLRYEKRRMRGGLFPCNRMPRCGYSFYSTTVLFINKDNEEVNIFPPNEGWWNVLMLWFCGPYSEAVLNPRPGGRHGGQSGSETSCRDQRTGSGIQYSCSLSCSFTTFSGRSDIRLGPDVITHVKGSGDIKPSGRQWSRIIRKRVWSAGFRDPRDWLWKSFLIIRLSLIVCRFLNKGRKAPRGIRWNRRRTAWWL